jgi:hypothetical protein
MKERGLMFKDVMVRAFLERRKTKTRRLVKDADRDFWTHRGWRPVVSCGRVIEWETLDKKHVFGAGAPRPTCPHGIPGDRIYVKETFLWDNAEYVARYKAEPWMGEPDPDTAEVHYRASELEPDIFTGWRSSMFMPRWASRLTFDIVTVRLERLQEITEEDAKAEGAEVGRYYPGAHRPPTTYREAFEDLWCWLHGRESWDANPWVWVLELKERE